MDILIFFRLFLVLFPKTLFQHIFFEVLHSFQVPTYLFLRDVSGLLVKDKAAEADIFNVFCLQICFSDQ